MRHDRRVVALTAAWGLLAVLAGVAAVGLPWWRGGVMPVPLDLMVGWVLLAGAVVVARFPWTATLLAASGVLWVGSGLAPYLDPLGEPLQRASLLPTALVVVAVVSLPRQLPRTRTQGVLSIAAAGAAVVGGIGYPRGTLVVMGTACIAAAPWSRHSQARLVQVGSGVGLCLVGVWGSVAGGPTVATVASLHDVILMAAAVGVVVVLLRVARLAGRLVPARRLGALLGEALGTRPLLIRFPCDAGWLDESGQPVPEPTGGARFGDGDEVLAWWDREPHIEAALVPSVRRLLRAAGTGARLRAELSSRADEIEASRERLVSAAADERAAVAAQLRDGPLTRLAAARKQVGSRRPDLVERFRSAADAITGMVEGLDPVAAGGGLTASLSELCLRSGARLDYRLRAAPSAEVARVLWFVCAEGLANAGKHAPGASVTVSVTERDHAVILRVADVGPGGADASGGGLMGLRERAISVGGSLVVRSGETGTSLEVVVPDTRFPLPVVAFSPTPTPVVAETVDA